MLASLLFASVILLQVTARVIASSSVAIKPTNVAVPATPGPRIQGFQAATAVPFPPAPPPDFPYSVLYRHRDERTAVTFILAHNVCIQHVRPDPPASWHDFGGKLQFFLPLQAASSSIRTGPDLTAGNASAATAASASTTPAATAATAASVAIPATAASLPSSAYFSPTLRDGADGSGYFLGSAHQEVLFGTPVPSHTNASVTWHTGLTAILRAAHANNVWHFWESVAMMWHLVLHPELYEFVRRIDQVVTPIMQDTEMQYNQDLLAVLLAAIGEVQESHASQPAAALPRPTPLLTQTDLLRSNPGMHCFEQVIAPGIVDTGDGRRRIHSTPQDAQRVRRFISKHLRTHFLPQPHVGEGVNISSQAALAPVRIVFENRCPGKRCLLNHQHVLKYLKTSSIGPYLDFGEGAPATSARGTSSAAVPAQSAAIAAHTGWLIGLTAHNETAPAPFINVTDGMSVSEASFSFGRFSFADQVTIAGNMDVWLGVHGAAVANTLLMHRNSVLVVMQPFGKSLSWHEGGARSSGIKYMYTPLFNVSFCRGCEVIPGSWSRGSPNNPNGPNPTPVNPNPRPEAVTQPSRRTQTINDTNGTTGATSSSSPRVCALRNRLACKFSVTPAELRLVENTLRQAVRHVYTVKRKVLFMLPPLPDGRPEKLYAFMQRKPNL